MKRTMLWMDDRLGNGWACSQCSWKFPVPTFLSDPEAKKAYDRLAASRFADHQCSPGLADPVDTSREPSFLERVRKLLKVGYKPRDAVDLALQELALEHRNDPQVMSRARAEGEEFLTKVKQGLI